MLNNASIQTFVQLNKFKLGVLLITLLGVAVRFEGLFANTFAADEALFAMWARYIAVWRDPLLFDVPTAVDKPPLLFYLQALFYPLQGPVEWAARLPNFFASILLVPLVGRIAYQITEGRNDRAWLAAAIVAFSPLAVQFSATAYTDPLLVFLVTVAIWCAIRPGSHQLIISSSALWLGVAFWAKYQAILFLPLILLLEWNHDSQTINNRRFFLRWILRFTACLIALLLWDLFSGRGIDLFSRQVSSYGGVALTPVDELMSRLWEWVKLFLYVPGWHLLLLLVLWPGRASSASISEKPEKSRLYLCGFVWLFMLFHWIVNIQAWDRYYLLLVPVIALFISLSPNLLSVNSNRLPPLKSWALIALLVGTFLFQAIPARNGAYPIGGQRWNDHGAALIAETVMDEPYGTVLYDHWYSWHWRYHFFYKGVYVEWFGDIEDLLDNLDAFYDPAAPEKRYLALQMGDLFSAKIETALQLEGYRLEPVTTEGRIELYVITKGE